MFSFPFVATVCGCRLHNVMNNFVFEFLAVATKSEMSNYTEFAGVSLISSVDSVMAFAPWNSPGPFSCINDNDVVMTMCDKGPQMKEPFACDSFNFNPNSGNGCFNALKTFELSPGNTTYLHTTRCGGGQVAKQVTSAFGVNYKYCMNTDNEWTLTNHYQVPLPLCQDTCDQHENCVGYSVDSSNCYIFGANTLPAGTSWIKIV